MKKCLQISISLLRSTCQHETWCARGFPQISEVVSFLCYKPVCTLSILLPFLKITTAIVIQYVAVDKTAQPKRGKLYTHQQKNQKLKLYFKQSKAVF
jgi:hypothetical protein